MAFFYKEIEIPDIFRSDATGALFERCLICDRYLLDGSRAYLIEKAVKQYPQYHARDTIFEYAVCLECSEKMYQSFSEESRSAVENYFSEHRHIFEQRMKDIDVEAIHVPDFLTKCVIKNTAVEELTEYQIVGMFRGADLVLPPLPYLVSGAVLEELTQLLSNKTIDILGGFIDEKLGLPPEFKDLLKDRPVFVF